MIRVSKNEYNGKLCYSFVFFTEQELTILEDILIQYYGSLTNIPKYTYLDLSFIRECLKLDMLEGVIYVDNSRIEANLNRLFNKEEKK